MSVAFQSKGLRWLSIFCNTKPYTRALILVGNKITCKVAFRVSVLRLFHAKRYLAHLHKLHGPVLGCSPLVERNCF